MQPAVPVTFANLEGTRYVKRGSAQFYIPARIDLLPASSFAKTSVSGKGNLDLSIRLLTTLVKVFAATPPYDGTLARYYRIPGHITYKLPDNLTLEDGALVCTPILLCGPASGIDPGD